MNKNILWIYLILMCLALNSLSQQFQNNGTYLNNYTNPINSQHLQDNHFFKLNKLASNEIAWKYNNFIGYDTLGNIIEKITSSFDPANNTLVITSKNVQQGILLFNFTETYTYDTKGYLISLINEEFKNNIWKKFLFTYTYDENQNLLSDQQNIWINNKWENQYKKEYVYNASQKLKNINWWYWQNGQWESSNVDLYKYDSIGNLIEILTKIKENNQRINERRHTYTFDSVGHLFTEWYEIFYNSIWNKREYKEFHYNEHDSISYRFSDLYSDNICICRITNNYLYDAKGNIIADTLKFWDFNYDSIPILGKTCLTTNTYNSNNNILSRTYWDGYLFNWNYITRKTYTYDSLGNSLNGQNEIFYNNRWIPGTGSLFIYNYRVSNKYFYNINRYESLNTTVTGKSDKIFIYPNPSNGLFCLEIYEPFTNPFSLSIFNSLNQIVYQTDDVSDNKLLIDLSKFSAGIYYLSANINNKQFFEKIIIQ